MSHDIVLQNLEADEQDILFRLYYMREVAANALLSSDFDSGLLVRLIEKHLVISSFESGENIISLTDEGLDVCGSVMVNRISKNALSFKDEVSDISQSAVSCLVNRVLWKESDNVDHYVGSGFDDSLWFERVLLKDSRIVDVLEDFYSILESIGFIKTHGGQRWCPPEVEGFLKDEYRNLPGLSWKDEDSLKYFFFLYAYAQDQKNLIDFSGSEELRVMFYEDVSLIPDFWLASDKYNQNMFLSSLGLNEQRVLAFFFDMEQRGILNERYYPMPSLSFFSDNDKIFLIKDIRGYMKFITERFLTSVVDSLLK